MFRIFLSLCSASSVQNQISPVTFRAGIYDGETNNTDDEDFPLYPDRQNSDGLKPKPKVEFGSHSARKHAIEDELFMFVLDLQLSESVMDQHKFMTDSNKSCFCYTYDNKNELTLSSILVIVLRNTVIGRPIPNSPGTSASGKNGERKANLLFACKCLVQLLNDYQEYPHDHDPSSPYNGNPFTSIEKALIVSDIFFTALINYVSLSANRKVVEESLNLHVHELLQAVLRIGSCLSLSESEAVKHLWAQIVARACSLLFYIVHALKTTVAVNSRLVGGFIKNMSDLVNILHSIGSALTLVKMQLSGTSAGFYTCSVLFWEACHRVLLLLKSKSYQVGDSKQSVMDPRYFMLCSQLMSTFYVSVPSAFEIQQEVSRTVEKDGFDAPLDENNDDHNLLNLLVETRSFFRYGGGGSSTAGDDKGGALLFALQRQSDHDATTRSTDGEAAGINMGDLTPNTPHVRVNRQEGAYFNQMSFRARYLLTGVTYLLRLSEFRREYSNANNSSNGNSLRFADHSSMLSLHVPNKPAWIATLAECLLTVLVPRAPSQGYHSLDVLALGPYLADLLLKVHFGSTDDLLIAPHSERLDVIYWELAKQLGVFTDLLKRRMRALNDSDGAHHFLNASAHTVTSGHSASSMSMHSTITESVRQRNAPPAVFSLSLETPTKDSTAQHLLPLSSSRRSIAGSPLPLLRHNGQSQGGHQQQPTTQRIQTPQRYEVGDLVDGMCELANGSKRWYPGKVISVDRASNTYSLLFNDGDVANDKGVDEVRYTKRRVPSNASTDSRPVIRPTATVSQVSEPLIAVSPAIVSPVAEFPAEEAVIEKSFTEPEAQPIATGNGSFITPIKTSMSSKDIAQPSPGDGELLYSPFTDKDSQSYKTVALKGMSVKSVQHDEDVDGDEADCLDDSSHFSDDDHVYEIPSVFEGGHARINNIIKSSSVGDRESIVPLMRFDQLDMTAALPQTSSAFSLSGVLISDQSFRGANMSSGRQPVHSVRSLDGSGNLFQLNLQHKNNSHFPDELSGATRMLSWRAQESGRASDRTTNIGFRPIGPPSDAYMTASREVSSQQKGTHHGQFTSSDDELSDDALSVLVETFSAVCGILLQRCIVDNASFLDHRCCACSEPHNQTSTAVSIQNSGRPGALQLLQAGSVDPETNMVFNVREFMEVSQGGGTCTSSLAELCMQHSDAALRLCKLLNGEFFHNCLPMHMDAVGVKIGEGGFGSVFQVCCTDSCGGFKQYKNCLACYRRSISMEAAASAKNTLSGKCVCWHASHHTNNTHSFAVKRIPRERSVYDSPIVLDLFNEVSALEALSSRIGVCGLEDYGVHGSEYWLVMENGGMNLLEWRLQAQSVRYAFLNRRGGEKEVSVRSNRSDDEMPIRAEDLSVLLTLFTDALYIVKSVHTADVAHFDLKCNNFVLRDDPRKNVAYMKLCHAQDKPSGILFLADFGEAVCYVNQPRSHPLKPKCRGTITVQSPEMLCASDMAVVAKSNPQSLFGARTGDRMSTIRSASVNSSSGSLSALPVNINSPNELNRVGGQTTQSQFQKTGKPGRKVFVDLPNTQSDIWSLGCLLYELLMSAQLFVEATWVELYHKLCMEPFVPIALPGLDELLKAVKSTDVVKDIESVIYGAMRQEPSTRNSLDVMLDEVQKVNSNLSSEILTSKQTESGALAQFPNKQLARVAQQDDTNRASSPNSSCTSPAEAVTVTSRYASLREQFSMLNFSHMHMGVGVYLALENSGEVLAHFDRHHAVQHSSRDPFDLDPLEINLNVPRTIGSIDQAMRSSSLSHTVGEVGRAVAQRQMRLDGGLIWVRISMGSTTSATAREKDRVFERFARKGGKACTTINILLGDAQDLASAVTVVQKTLSKIAGIHVRGQSVVVVSVDSAVLSADTKGLLEQQEGDVFGSGAQFDKQSLSVGIALCGLLTSWISNSSSSTSKTESSHRAVLSSRSAASLPVERVSTVICLDRLVQLWRCLPWFEAGCSQEVVDFIVRRIHEDSL